MNLWTQGHWLELDEVESTQNEAVERLRRGLDVGVVFAHHQGSGRGRFGRPWLSQRGFSLTMSIVFEPNPGDQRPWLVGMAVACVCAKVVGCQVRWPNDLVFGKDQLKVGGILTELHDGVPVVGIGINLSGDVHPNLAERATNLGSLASPLEVARSIVAKLAQTESPQSWFELAPDWLTHDATPGKRYQLASGEVVTAVRVGEIGELIARDDRGAEVKIMAADALFGPSTA